MKTERLLLSKGAERLGIDLEEEALERLLLYLAELVKWNRRINLIARDTREEQIIETHFLDSLTLLPFLLEQRQAPQHLLDVGSGAGFPGLVLATVLPEVRFTLAEPRAKRVSFLRHLIRTLRLTNTEVHAERIEALMPDRQGCFTHITGRAVAEPALFLPLVRPLVSPETRVVLMLARTELLASIEQLPSGPWHILDIRTFNLPFSAASRVLAVVGACL
ncbi:16S rRNA (guanine(527)-N(7))-methyltransferase RsmG [Desulfobulbus alkaliphilus]|uniref:16S rRNA (guanine(527)-N(7))-methyltransferase RsmG n=1 Tax=Desulfobulbus alkaliphilus TaxID=869814 RepID=UPI00308457F0|nr:16S rRNA (guanine(527)-N(7))-methyltransferase RsmG [Desulfobulbus alkaliphilus]